MVVPGLAMKLVAEFLGTFLLMVSVLTSGANYLIVGATLALIMFLIGGISGAPVNPAVAAGMWYSGSLDTLTYSLYAGIEVLGAIAAAYSYRVIA